ncbi:YciI family protein [Pseudoalteromonas luteoviolacea]|nr:hypothetical protein [Pseudoalteromonas luteoviolacea]
MMFIVQLKFSENKSQAKTYMQGHNEWLKTWFDNGIFVLSGSIQPNVGGGIIAINITREDLDEIVAGDPFVKENIVTPEIVELSPSKYDERLAFLLDT